jgi:RNA polymerase sigma-70 factor (ECF subfamily)
MDELALVKSALAGELDAFNRLVLAYQDLAFNVAFRILGDEDQASDATQNAFLSAYKNLRSFRGGSFKAWVLRMVTNSCYDELRHKQRHPAVSLDPKSDDDSDEMDSNEWLASDEPSPETTLEQAEVEHALQHCLEHLSVEFRTVVVLVDVQGMDYEEVSHSLGKPLGTVKSRLARARLHMRDCLHPFQELLPAEYRLEEEVQE